MTIGYVKESEYIKKFQTDQQENMRAVSEISQDKLPPMAGKSAFNPRFKRFRISEET